MATGQGFPGLFLGRYLVVVLVKDGQKRATEMQTIRAENTVNPGILRAGSWG